MEEIMAVFQKPHQFSKAAVVTVQFALEFWLQGQYHLANLADFPKPILWRNIRNKKRNYRNDLKFSPLLLKLILITC
jgi:hypothetical protein